MVRGAGDFAPTNLCFRNRSICFSILANLRTFWGLGLSCFTAGSKFRSGFSSSSSFAISTAFLWRSCVSHFGKEGFEEVGRCSRCLLNVSLERTLSSMSFSSLLLSCTTSSMNSPLVDFALISFSSSGIEVATTFDLEILWLFDFCLASCFFSAWILSASAISSNIFASSVSGTVSPAILYSMAWFRNFNSLSLSLVIAYPNDNKNITSKINAAYKPISFLTLSFESVCKSSNLDKLLFLAVAANSATENSVR
mmetsp:Transcript_10900/g.11927  ORF Transcript_10900/g.11927 Transcript_10900/m.11927 type:complete len:253 (+) Transcript_10900:877-1635(+)